MVVKFNLYINSCINDILIDKKKYPLVKNPKISAIIPIYNGGKYLHYSLRSIQNQKMKDIEIILIDDCSNDTTLRIIEKYMKEDERIRLIKNIENRKILYSKSFAALNSKGKYIIELDQDDIFIRDDVFDILYYEAKKDDLDLVHIRDITKQSLVFDDLTKVNIRGRHYIISKKTHYKKQPELKDKMFIQGNNYLLWGLLIKSDIYKKAIYHLWPLIINYKIVYHEDYTITFMLIILAKKYKYLNHFVLFIYFIQIPPVTVL
jgi:glycosyltransferase involved in cell wall biosynthesis